MPKIEHLTNALSPHRKPTRHTHPTAKAKPSFSPPPPRPNPLKYRTIPIVLGSITLLGLSGYISYLYVLLSRPPPENIPTLPSHQADVSQTYNTIASSFDSHVSVTEQATGINTLRRKLAKLAHGDVLEVSIGTGRNLEYYEFDFKRGNEGGGQKKGLVRSFTAVDKSAEMLEIAHDKFGKLFPGILGVRWVIGDASQPGIIPPPPKSANERSGNLEGKKYDTILQTMGLCSVDDPVALLKSLGEHVVEEEGRILLLEHGRGKWKWLNGALDRGAEGHAKQFGCWWNRDFTDVIEESGLEVVRVERPKWWHGGTTWWIELKKPRSSSPGSVKQVGESVKEVVEEVKAKKGFSLWAS